MPGLDFLKKGILGKTRRRREDAAQRVMRQAAETRNRGKPRRKDGARGK